LKGRRGPKVSLAESHPRIARDWCDERNDPLRSTDVASHEKRRVWWRCPEGHTYEVSVYTRVRTGGCKVCAWPEHVERGRRTKLGKSRSLADAKPDFLSEWHWDRNAIRPEQLSTKSRITVWWRCGRGHEWESSPKRRWQATGCPTCVMEAAPARIRAALLRKAGASLSECYPDLLVEWDHERNEFAPGELTPHSNYTVHWICRYGHRWESTVSNRTLAQSGCPECKPASSRLEIYLLCELRHIYPETEWRKKIDGVECDLFVPSAQIGIEVDGAYWHRNKRERDQRKTETLEASGVTLFRVRETGLPSLPGRILWFSRAQENQDICMALVAELAKHQPGDEGLSQYLADGAQQRAAEYRELIARFPAPPEGETLADTHPAVAAEWDHEENWPLQPDLFSAGSMHKAAWRCRCGYGWRATIKNRTARTSGCPRCAAAGISSRVRTARAHKQGSLADRAPRYLTQWDTERNAPVTPAAVAATSGFDAWWLCAEGHSFKKSPARMARDPNCPTCASVAVRFPKLVAEWLEEPGRGLRPEDVAAGSGRSVRWRCQLGHEWVATVRSRAVDGTGCPTCFEYRRARDPAAALARRSGQTLGMFRPHWITEWDGEQNPGVAVDDVPVNSDLDYWWRCVHGHAFLRSARRRSRDSRCPECTKAAGAESARLSRLQRTGSLADNYPALAAEWHPTRNAPLTPHGVGAGSKTPIWWLCTAGHEFQRTVNDRVTLVRRKGRPWCPACRQAGSEA
jgi:hypothetical protein